MSRKRSGMEVCMRRPVCLIGLAFVIIIRFYLLICPLSAISLKEADKCTVTLTGRVDKKEYRISEEKKTLVIYLNDVSKVQVLNPQTGRIQQTQERQFIEEQLMQALSKIEGVICYMEGGGEEEPKSGSIVRLQGKLRAFGSATNPGEFDAEAYYQILHLQARIQNAVILEESVSYDAFREGLWQIRRYFSSLLEICFAPGDASVMKAMLLGEKSGLDEEIKQLYQLNGIIHILSISGLHISIIGMGVYKILHKIRCPRQLNILLSVCFMYGYGVMTGMGISAIRAIAMFSFRLAAGIFARTYDMLTAMTIVALSVLIDEPRYLYHSGFLFSFGAILAIGIFLPVMEENLLGKTKIEKAMSASLSVFIVTFPVYLCFYYEYPLYSLFLNLLVIPGTSLLVSDGLISVLAAALDIRIGKIAALPAHVLLSVYEYCCLFTLKLPGSRNILGRPDTWQIVVYGIIICTAVLYSRKWSKMQFWLWVLLALLSLTLRVQDGLQVTFLDVGQGDGICITDNRNGCYFIDGGSSDKSDVGTYQIIPFLKAQGIDTLRAVFVTHMDIDHYNGIQMLIEEKDSSGIVVENLILPDIGVRSRSDAYKELEALAKQNGVMVHEIHMGETFRHGKLRFTCLYPQEKAEGETNALSVVLYMEYEAFSALFTGDLEGNGEEEVRRQLEERCAGQGISLLKVAHHGSRYSTGELFLETIRPQVALISAGRDNKYGHPHEELLERLVKGARYVYQTKEGGAVTVTYRNGKMKVEEFLEER